MRTSSRITLNTMTKWAFVGTKAVIWLMLVPFLLSRLGKGGYGLIALAGVIVGFTELADLGLRSGLARLLAAQVARKDTQQFNQLVSTAMVAYVTIGVLCAVAIIVFAPALVRLLKAPEELIPQAVFLVRWYASVAVLLSFLTPVFGATLVSNNRFDVMNYIALGWSILQGAGFFLVLGLTRTGLYGWVWVSIATEILKFLVIRRAAYRIWPSLQLRIRHLRAGALGSLFSLGGKMFVFRVTNLISVRADPIIITRFFGPAGVALYHPGLVLPRFARQLVEALRAQLHPLATGYHVRGKREQLQAVLFRGTRYTLLMGIPACVALAIFAHPIMKVWIGGTPIGEGYRTAAWVLIGWATVDLLNYAGGSQWPVLLGMNRLKFLVWTQVGAGVVNVLTSIYLVGYTSLGIVGVIVPTIIITAIRRPIVAAYTAWACETSARRYLRESYMPPIVVTVLLVAASAAIRVLIAPQSMLSVAACVIGVGLLWVPLCWWIGFNREDRTSFLDLFGRVRAKLLGGRAGAPGPEEQAPLSQGDAETTSGWDEQAPGLSPTDDAE